VSQRTARRLLFLALLFCVPLPYWGIEVERGPAVRLFLLTVMTSAVAVAEGGFEPRLVGGLFVLQSLLAAGVLYLLARLLVRVLPVARRGTAVAVVVAVLVGVALQRIFYLPFAHSAPHANLLGIFR
jgi:hypothetical protein